MQERIFHAKMVTVILNEIRLGQNCFFTFSTFTFKQGQNAENDKIKHFQRILYILKMTLNSISYIQCILVKVNTQFYAK